MVTDRTRDAGFSLIEVLAALMLLAVSLAAFYPAFRDAAFGLVRAEERLAANVFAQSFLEQALQSRRLAAGTSTGNAGGYAWSMSVTPSAEQEEVTVGAPPSPWQLHDIVLEVSWGTPPRRMRLATAHLLAAVTGAAK